MKGYQLAASLISLILMSSHALGHEPVEIARPVIINKSEITPGTVTAVTPPKRNDQSEHAFLDHLKDCSPYTRDLGHLGLSVIKGEQNNLCEVLFVSNKNIHDCKFPKDAIQRLTSEAMYRQADLYLEASTSPSLNYYRENYCQTKILPQNAQEILTSEEIRRLDDTEGNITNVCLKMYYQMIYALDKPTLSEFEEKLGPGRSLGTSQLYRWQTPEFNFDAIFNDGRLIFRDYDIPLTSSPQLLEAAKAENLNDLITLLGGDYSIEEKSNYAWVCEGNLPMIISFNTDGSMYKLYPLNAQAAITE